MKRPAQRVLILAVSIFSIILILSCEEQNYSNVKKHKLIAVEKARLKEKLDQCDEKIRNQEKQLEKCEKEKKYLKTKATEKLRDRMDYMIESLSKQNKQLREQNEELTAKVQKLEAKVKQLEKELEQIKKPGPQPLSPNP